jgi:hypothetical protein
MSDPPPTTAVPLALHLAPRTADGTSLTVKRRPGRPRVVRPAPDADAGAYNEAVCRARAEAVADDAVVRAVESKRSDGVLPEVLVALAREAAALRWEREQGQQNGRDVAQIGSRRIDALHKAALVLLGQRRLGIDTVNPRGEKMKRIVDLFLSNVGDGLQATLPRAQADELLSQVRDRLRAWAATADPL